MASLLLHSSNLGIDPPPLHFGVRTRLKYGVVVVREREGRICKKVKSDTTNRNSNIATSVIFPD